MTETDYKTEPFCPGHVFEQMCEAVALTPPPIAEDHDALNEWLTEEYIEWYEDHDLEGHADDPRIYHAFLAEKVVLARYWNFKKEQELISNLDSPLRLVREED
jgi:hypothetical protein